jgi:hypothetical protein
MKILSGKSELGEIELYLQQNMSNKIYETFFEIAKILMIGNVTVEDRDKVEGTLYSNTTLAKYVQLESILGTKNRRVIPQCTRLSRRDDDLHRYLLFNDDSAIMCNINTVNLVCDIANRMKDFTNKNNALSLSHIEHLYEGVLYIGSAIESQLTVALNTNHTLEFRSKSYCRHILNPSVYKYSVCKDNLARLFLLIFYNGGGLSMLNCTPDFNKSTLRFVSGDKDFKINIDADDVTRIRDIVSGKILNLSSKQSKIRRGGFFPGFHYSNLKYIARH